MSDLRSALAALGGNDRHQMATRVQHLADLAYSSGNTRLGDAWRALLGEIQAAAGAEVRELLRHEQDLAGPGVMSEPGPGDGTSYPDGTDDPDDDVQIEILDDDTDPPTRT
jgi:hypothetical protein